MDGEGLLIPDGMIVEGMDLGPPFVSYMKKKTEEAEAEAEAVAVAGAEDDDDDDDDKTADMSVLHVNKVRNHVVTSSSAG